MNTNEDIIRCRRCHREMAADDLDRILWCDECVAAERRRAAWLGRAIAVAAVALLAVWIAAVVRPDAEFRILWALVVIVGYALGARLAHELTFGVNRIRNREGARAATKSGDHDADGGHPMNP